MKVYAVLVDTTVLVPALRELAAEKGAHVLHQVTQCYTNASVYSLLTGCQLSDLEDHGTGYYGGMRYHQPFVDDEGVTRQGVVWPWREKNLLRVLQHEGWDVHVHNGSRETWWDPFIDYDPRITHTSTMDAGGFDTPHALDIVMRRDPAWIAQETEAIRRFQAARPERPTFYVVTYHDMHSAALRETGRDIAHRSLQERLRAWDWDEPDTVFWVWADHGDYGEYRIDGRLRAPNWLAWAMLKDNTAAPIQPGRRLISIRDVRPTLLARFAPARLEPTDASPITEPLDPDRIYVIEDSRWVSDSVRCDATAAALFVDWRDGLPRFVLQCTYDDKRRYGWDFQFFVSAFNDGRPEDVRAVDSFHHDWRLRHLTFAEDPHARLKAALRARIDWVARGGAEPVHRRHGTGELAAREVLRRVRAVVMPIYHGTRVAGGRVLRALHRRMAR